MPARVDRLAVEDMLAAACAGERAALARLLSLIERGGDGARAVSRLVASRSGAAFTVGITGAPGAGKSTLTGALVRHVRGLGMRVAVLAIDPSSPYTGGALLGDRVRMQDHATDDGVFIRSMATRGHLGGLSLATPEAVRLLDAVGYRLIVIETVGVGQVEVDVAGRADTTVVVVNPGWGDSVQASKAGLMEIADVFAINKSDRPGADRTRRDLLQMIELGSAVHGGETAWRPPVVATVGTTGEGAAELWTAIEQHHAAATQSGVLARRRQLRAGEELRQLVARRLLERAGEIVGAARSAALADQVGTGALDPWQAADQMVAAALGDDASDSGQGDRSETTAGTGTEATAQTAGGASAPA